MTITFIPQPFSCPENPVVSAAFLPYTLLPAGAYY